MHLNQPAKRREYNEAFKAEALRLAQESRSARTAAQQLSISETLLYRWRRAQIEPDADSAAQAQDPQWRALRTETPRLERELAVLKKALASCLL